MSLIATSFLSAGYDDNGELCWSGKNIIPSRVTKLNTEELISVSIGGSHCAAVYIDGKVFGWGYNGGRRIGLSIFKNHEKIKNPSQINDLPPIMKVKCGYNFTVFLGKNNNVFIATSNESREKRIEKVATSGKCVSIFGFKYPWIVCKNNTLYKIKNYDKEEAKEMTKFELPKTAKSKKIKVILSPLFTPSDICLTESGEIFGIGEVANNSKEFVEIESLKNQNIKKVSGIGDHIVALTEDGKVFVWGNYYLGQLGLGNKGAQKGNFVEIPEFSKFKIVDVSAGACFSVFVCHSQQKKDRVSKKGKKK